GETIRSALPTYALAAKVERGMELPGLPAQTTAPARVHGSELMQREYVRTIHVSGQAWKGLKEDSRGPLLPEKCSMSLRTDRSVSYQDYARNTLSWESPGCNSQT